MASQIHAGRMAGTSWNPTQYLKFSDHRLRPALELMNRIPHESPLLIYDLGCGTGNVTRLLAKQWPSATVYGLDNSSDMLQKAQADPSPVQWIHAHIENWTPEKKPDLIYTNATLQWLSGHNELFPRLIQLLNPNGCLAVQMPLSWTAPSHRLMRETLDNGGASGQSLGTEELRQSVARKWVEDTQVYYDLLMPYATHLDIWETEYLQVLEGEDPVLEWVQGTGLRPILNGLAEGEKQQFLDRYRHRLRQAYPMKPDGKTLYPFKRLFMIARV